MSNNNVDYKPEYRPIGIGTADDHLPPALIFLWPRLLEALQHIGKFFGPLLLRFDEYEFA
jgi:hypothetical protein